MIHHNAKITKIFKRSGGNGQIIVVELKLIENNKVKYINRNIVGDVKIGDYIVLLNPNKEDKIYKK